MASTFERAALRDLTSPSIEELDHAVLQGLRAAFWLAAGSTIAGEAVLRQCSPLPCSHLDHPHRSQTQRCCG